MPNCVIFIGHLVFVGEIVPPVVSDLQICESGSGGIILRMCVFFRHVGKKLYFCKVILGAVWKA